MHHKAVNIQTSHKHTRPMCCIKCNTNQAGLASALSRSWDFLGIFENTLEFLTMSFLYSRFSNIGSMQKNLYFSECRWRYLSEETLMGSEFRHPKFLYRNLRRNHYLYKIKNCDFPCSSNPMASKKTCPVRHHYQAVRLVGWWRWVVLVLQSNLFLWLFKSITK
jgi:hypothetical protein